MAFDIFQAIAGKNAVAADPLEIKHIDIHDLVPSEENFYSMTDIEELKKSIELYGIKQNLVVTDIGDGKYRIIAGHRRAKAVLELSEAGNKDFDMMPCTIEQIDPLDEKLLLITTNSAARVLTDYEKTRQAAELKMVLTQCQEQGTKLPAPKRKIIAEYFKISETQIARMDAINNNLSPEFMTEFEQQKIGISEAYELSGMPIEKQAAAYEQYQEAGDISVKDIRQMKKIEDGETLATLEAQGQIVIPDLEEQIVNEYGIYLNYEEIELKLTDRRAHIKIEVAFDPTDQLYRYGVDCKYHLGGIAYSPSTHCKGYRTKEAALEAAIQSLSKHSAMRPLLIKSGYLSKEQTTNDIVAPVKEITVAQNVVTPNAVETVKAIPVVYISSPYSHNGEFEKNVEFAKVCCMEEIEKGRLPVAPHLYLPLFLQEPEDRETAMLFCLELINRCDYVRICGSAISAGMRAEIAYAEKHGIKVTYDEK